MVSEGFSSDLQGAGLGERKKAILSTGRSPRVGRACCVTETERRPGLWAGRGRVESPEMSGVGRAQAQAMQGLAGDEGY